MDEREKQLIDAAAAVVARRGAAHLTMREIAEEAGVSRQTLYNAFPSKRAVLMAIVVKHAAEARARVRADWTAAMALDQKLARVFDHMVLRPHGLLSALRGADVGAVLREEAARDAALVAEALLPFAPALRVCGLSAAEAAAFTLRAARGLRDGAEDAAQLTGLLAALTASVLAMTGTAVPAAPRGRARLH